MAKNTITAKELHNAIQQANIPGGKEDDALSIINNLQDLSILDVRSEYHGYNALHFASRYSTVGVVKTILNKNPDLIDSLTTNRNKVLQLADKQEVADFLFKQSPLLIYHTNSAGYAAIHNATLTARKELVAYYLDTLTDEQIAQQTEIKRHTILHFAAQRGFNDIIKMILEKAPGLINVPDTDGCIPAHYAASLHHEPEVLLTLLEAGNHPAEQIAMQAANGYTPVHFAAQYNRDKSISIMLKIHPHASKILGTNDKSSPLHVAAHYNSIEATKILCNFMEPSDITVADKNGKTPLIIAIEKARDEIAELLSNKGSNQEGADELQKSIINLTDSKVMNSDDSLSLKALTDTGLFVNQEILLTALGNRIQNAGDFAKAYKYYKEAKKITDTQKAQNAQLSMSGVYNSFPYEPEMVQELLKLQLDNTYNIVLVEVFSRHNGFPSEAKDKLTAQMYPLIKSVMDQDQDKKVLLLLHDSKKCTGAIKLIRHDEDTCTFIYINPVGTAYTAEPVVKYIVEILSDMEVDIKLTDLRKQQIPSDDPLNAGVFIIETLRLFDKADNSSSKSTLVKLLPDQNSDFNLEKNQRYPRID